MFISPKVKQDPKRRWELPDELFFSNGACQVLAYTFLETYPNKGFKAVWISPKDGHSGNHIYVTNGDIAFDYQGFKNVDTFIAEYKKNMSEIFYQWDCELVELPKYVLISEKESKKYDGLWLREPKDFLHDPIPRAKEYLAEFKINERLN